MIERSADLLTVLALAFVVQSILRRNGAWLRLFWVRAGLPFGRCACYRRCYQPIRFILLVKPLSGSAFLYLPWQRPSGWQRQTVILCHADLHSDWAGGHVRYSDGQVLIEGQKGGRFGPMAIWCPAIMYKVGLPAFTIMVALLCREWPDCGCLRLVALITMAISVMTGERINFLIRACGGMLAACSGSQNGDAIWVW